MVGKAHPARWRSIQGEAMIGLRNIDISEFIKMKNEGATVEEVYHAAEARSLTVVQRIELLVVVFGLTINEAKSIMLRETGIADSLEEHTKNWIEVIGPIIDEYNNKDN